MKDLTITVNPILRITRIDLHGPLSAIPSTTNRRMISRGRIIRDPKCRKALDDMTYLFRHESRLIQPLVAYGSTLVHVLVILGERYDSKGRRVNRWDSHNMAKAVGDWLQSAEIIEDDSRAEIWCCKRVDYFDDTKAQTTIIIQPRASIADLVESLIRVINLGSLELCPMPQSSKG